MSFVTKIMWEIEGLKFLIRNIKASKLLPKIDSKRIDGFLFEGLSCSEIFLLNQIHKDLRGGEKLNFWRLVLYFFFGKKLIAIVKNKSGNLIAFQMYYFKCNELEKGIIHEAFIGVRTQFRNFSIATRLRIFTHDTFKKTSMTKISSSISRSNIPSLRSAIKSGFVVDEEHSNNEIYYLYRDISNLNS